LATLRSGFIFNLSCRSNVRRLSGMVTSSTRAFAL
jgi:hypothetical protein